MAGNSEFLNRIDDVLMFNQLNHKDVTAILEIQLGLLERRLQDQHITLKLSQEAKDWLAEKGYDSDKTLVWPFYDNHRSGFTAIRASFDSANNVEIVVEESL